MLAGTTIVRMIVASSSTATAKPKPDCCNGTTSPIAKPEKTATRIRAAPRAPTEVGFVRPVTMPDWQARQVRAGARCRASRGLDDMSMFV